MSKKKNPSDELQATAGELSDAPPPAAAAADPATPETAPPPAATIEASSNTAVDVIETIAPPAIERGTAAEIEDLKEEYEQILSLTSVFERDTKKLLRDYDDGRKRLGENRKAQLKQLLDRKLAVTLRLAELPARRSA